MWSVGKRTVKSSISKKELAQYFYAVGMAAAFEFIREGSKEDKKIPAIKSNESEPKRITLKDADNETKIE